MPAPRRVNHPPFVQFRGPTVWTTLTLTMYADGRVEHALAGTSPFPRHWVYAGAGKSGIFSAGDFAAVEREEIKRAVKQRAVRLVVATDAACEGLNLQTGQGHPCGAAKARQRCWLGRKPGPAGNADFPCGPPAVST